MRPATQQRKRPVVRAFTGRLVGLPPDEPVVPTLAPQVSVIVPTAELAELMGLVSQANTDKQVKKVVRDVFARKRRRRRAAPVVEDLPELPTSGEPDPGYDAEIYRTEINKALAYTRSNMRGQEGKKNFDDLRQIVDIEIWKATKHYGDKMNSALVFMIAKNQARKFVRGLAKEPVFLSIDHKPEDSTGEPMEMSYAEVLVNAEMQQDIEGRRETGDWSTVLAERGGIPALEKLVQSWHGSKRIVGEWLLKYPEATVRDFPGMSKTTSARVRKVVLAEFERFVRSVEVPSTQQDTD